MFLIAIFHFLQITIIYKGTQVTNQQGWFLVLNSIDPTLKSSIMKIVEVYWCWSTVARHIGAQEILNM